MILNQFYDSQRMFKKDLLKYKPFRTGLPALLSLFKMSKNALSSKGYAAFSSVKLRRT